MKNNYLTVVACLFLFAFGINKSSAQSGPEFLDCADTISLCVDDEGVRLSANNKFFLGEENPDATSCSVHVTQTRKVRSTCGKTLRYEVLLFLFDTSAPFILQPPTYIHTDSLGEAELSFDSELSPEALIKTDGIPYTTGCNRFHRIKWIVMDSCAAVAICETRIDLYDCFKPVFVVPDLPDIVYQTVSGFLHLYLEDIYREPKDDCTFSDEYLYSFSPDVHKADSSFYICDFPNWGVEFLHDIWIGDKGRDLDCNGIIEWSERSIEKEQIKLIVIDPGYIDCWPGDPLIAGQIITEDYQTIGEAHVTLSSPGQMYPSIVTAADGIFNFFQFLPTEFSIRVSRNDAHKNGVSTLDLVKIQKHLLGSEVLTSPYDIIAADANNSQSVSAIDLVELRKLVLGKYTELPNNTSWRFVPEFFVFQDTAHPWPLVEEINEMNMTSGFDFIGIKIGDVNNTVQPNAQSIEERTIPNKSNLYCEQKDFMANELFEISFYTGDTIDLQGFQFTLSNPDLEFMEAYSSEIEIDENSYALFDDNMTFSWFDESGVKLSNGDIVFTVKARAKKDGNLKHNLTINSNITEAEVYSMTNEIFTPELIIPVDNTNVFLTPELNPWRYHTSIPFSLLKAGEATLEIFDLNGQRIYSRNEMFASGENKFLISSDQCTQKGLLFYSITTGPVQYSGKMIVLE